MLFERATLNDAAKSVLAARGYSGGEQDMEADRFFVAAEDLIGVLVAQAPDRFGFLHLTFQEFYAARAIAKKREEERAALIARFWDHSDWREVWPLYALTVQNEPAKYEHLFATIVASGHELDAHLYRPQLACLRLAGVGSAPQSTAAATVLDWAYEVLEGATYPLLPSMRMLGTWNRRLTDKLRAMLLTRLGDLTVSRTAAGVLGAAVGDLEVRASLLVRLDAQNQNVRPAAIWAMASAANDKAVQEVLLARLDDQDGWIANEAERSLLAAIDNPMVWVALVSRIRKTQSIMREVTDALGSVAQQRCACSAYYLMKTSRYVEPPFGRSGKRLMRHRSRLHC